MHILHEGLDPNIDSTLIDAIKNNEAIIYVGAGASKSAGLPDWKTFLNNCLKKANNDYLHGSQVDLNVMHPNLKLTKKVLDEGDYILAAELLQKELGEKRISKLIWDAFGHHKIPTVIHQSIARIPFSHTITTNYDQLLEIAYRLRSQHINVCTWKNTGAIFTSIKNNRRALFKIHGDVDKSESLVLTTSNYKNLIFENGLYNDLLSHLFTFKTFLFVGSSLKDKDLIHLLDQGKSTFGNNFGPHYAFLFEDEADTAFIRHLEDSYSIKSIISKAPNSEKTNSLSSFLKVLSGRVSNSHFVSNLSESVNSISYDFNKILKKKLEELVNKTGADKASVFFLDSEHLDLPRLRYFSKVNIKKNTILHFDLLRSGEFEYAKNLYKEFHTDESETIKRPYVLQYKNLSSVFLSKVNTLKKYVYVTEENNEYYFDTDLQEWEYDFKSNPIFRDTKSVLLSQIVSDGQAIGVVAIESSIFDSFTQDHLVTLKESTTLLGAAFKGFELRNKSVQDLNLSVTAEVISDFLKNSFLLEGYKLSHLFYEIDYRNGRIKAIFPEGHGDEKYNDFYYNFDESSLATYVFKEQTEKFYEKLDVGIKQGIINRIGLEKFNILNSIFATPVKVNRYTSFILISWSTKVPKPEKSNSLSKIASTISRLAHLIANSIDRDGAALNGDAKDYMMNLRKRLRKIDNKRAWEIKLLEMPRIRLRLKKELLISLTHPSCGIKRVRLWIYNRKEKCFELEYSYSTPDATIKGKKQENAYAGIKTPISNPYCDYTLRRYSDNPYAMHQHKDMLEKDESNQGLLDKDVNGRWIVCPLTNNFNSNIYGFISCDNHKLEGERLKEESRGDKIDAYQRYCVDVVSNLLSSIVRYEYCSKHRKWK